MNDNLIELTETLRRSVHAADPTQQDVVIVDLHKQVENIQSHVTKLEARNNELQEALKEINEVGCDDRIAYIPKVYRINKIAEQALKQ